MPSKHTQQITLSEQQRNDLELIIRQRKSAQSMVLRAKIILAGAEGKSLLGTTKELGCNRETVTRWRKHWVERSDELSVLEKLKEAPRPGAKPKFTEEQICLIVAMSCDKPEEHGYPLSHWSESSLAMAAQDKGIVPSISQRQVGRYLKSADIRPDKVKGWVDSPRDEAFEIHSADVCDTYRQAIERAEQGIRTISFDEKTGIQALEPLTAGKPVKPGHIEKREFEYKRHGTQALLAGMDVATGKIIPLVRDTRTEQDFADWLDSTLMSDPHAAGWHFVMDRLNTHMSEAAVKAVARIEGTPEKELGVKGKSGILKNMKTRAAYLSDVSHKIVFHYTPKHASWLNQIEIWFSILVRRFLKRNSFTHIHHPDKYLINLHKPLVAQGCYLIFMEYYWSSK